MKKRAWGGAATLLIVLVAAAGVGSPASASLSECNAGRACAWTSLSYQGAPSVEFASSVVFAASDNKADSIANNGNTNQARFYAASDFTGTSITMNNPARGGQTRDPDLRNGTNATSVDWSNKISSAKFI